MRKKIFRNFSILALACLFVASILFLGIFYTVISQNTWKTLQEEMRLIENAVAADSNYFTKIKAADTRVTLIAPDGVVLQDNKANPQTMENHGDRPEVAEAFANTTGRAVRFSNTLGENIYYYAKRLANGDVLRVAVTANSIFAIVPQMVLYIGLVLLVTLVLASLLAKAQTKRIVAPLEAVDLNKPMNADVYEELSPFLRRIEKQNDTISRQLGQIEQKQKEFETVTQNLAEGLVLLNAKGELLSINQSALSILEARQGEYTGRHFLELNRNLELEKVTKQALAGSHTEASLAFGAKKYRLSAAPVLDGRCISGVVLLLTDETEKQENEQRRREFTANVSHELKTPLTSISGYAEIMQNGLVKPEDVPEFSGRIHDEAFRLIALVNDIIKLSQLDESNLPNQQENVDLLAVCKIVAQRLESETRRRDIQLAVSGDSAVVNGIPALLEEVVYNLSDNAIKYNHVGGFVDIEVRKEREKAVLMVSDSGIGIPKEQHERIFERFYRGDTSHSSEVRGTGLGLSIVKHGVLAHGGEIHVESVVGEGSRVTITIPFSRT